MDLIADPLRPRSRPGPRRIHARDRHHCHCPSPSVLSPQSSVLSPQSSVLSPLSSVLGPQSFPAPCPAATEEASVSPVSSPGRVLFTTRNIRERP